MKALLLDVDGVLLHHDRDYEAFRCRWEERLGIGDGRLNELLWDPELDAKALTGAMSPDDYWAAACVRLGIEMLVLRELLGDMTDRTRVDHELVAHVTSLRPQVRVALVTNSWSDRRPKLLEYGFDSFCDDIVISGEVGVAKPEPRIFELACERLGVAPQDAVFLDDREDNVAAAAAIGIRAHVYRGFAEVAGSLTLPATSPISP